MSPPDTAQTGETPARPGLLRRATAGRWWWIITQWGVLSAALMAWTYIVFGPVYEASAWIVMRPIRPSILGPSRESQAREERLLETAAELLRSPFLVRTIATEWKFATMPRLSRSLDPERELRKAIRVATGPRTNIIEVSVAWDNPAEAATIANALVESYEQNNRSEVLDELEHEKKLFITFETDLEAQIKNAHRTLQALNEKGQIEAAHVRPDGLRGSVREQSERYLAEFDAAEIMRIKTEARLDALRKWNPRTADSQHRRVAQIEDLELDAATNAFVATMLRERLPSLAQDPEAGDQKRESVRADLVRLEAIRDALEKQGFELNYQAQRQLNSVRLLRAHPPAHFEYNARWPVVAAVPFVVLAVLLAFYSALRMLRERLGRDALAGQAA